MKYSKKTFLTTEKEPGQIVSATALLIPFYSSMLGLALRTYVDGNGSVNAVVYVFKKDLEVGYKLATCHGLKTTVEFMVPFQ
ncbi:LOW QUALITY PROTEIN: uncharacterized protein ColTof4_14452 [Colletotrichum tofieldiae]|nr:LOW QUALITY PROTEIN: uncharacterized protein ColTof3_14826 [Colletotrichum tofieldiae]GKT82029.1 LOW QUALITY PROTEIN: uncharacterized protein ColTof4_14452 [Colletotrichum tofieldiae]